MISNDLWGFSIDLPYFGYNSADRKTLVCVFLRFKNLPEHKLTSDFLGVNILSREPSRAQEVNEGGHEGQTRPGGAGPWPSCATQARLGLGPPILSIFVSLRST
jgi:hypothetical protein